METALVYRETVGKREQIKRKLPSKKLYALIWIEFHVIYGVKISVASIKIQKIDARNHNFKQVVLTKSERVASFKTEKNVGSIDFNKIENWTHEYSNERIKARLSRTDRI